MKKLTHISLALLFTASVRSALALSFNPDDLLLVFHDANTPPSISDVEYDLGSVTNLTSLAPGATTTLFTDDGTVLNNFNTDYTSARMMLVANDDPSGGVTTSSRLWLTTVNPAATVTFFGKGSSAFGTVLGRLNSAGNDAANNATGSSYIDSPGDGNSYSHVAFNGAPTTSLGVGTFGSILANATRIDGTNNSTIPFYQITYSGSAAMTGQLIGTVTWDTSGTVTFTAASGVVTPPLTKAVITHISRLASSTQVSFTTTNGNHYQLLYTPSLSAPVTWVTNVAAGVVTGNNSITNLTDTTTDAARFYRIQSF